MIDNPYKELIEEESENHDVDPDIVAAICKVESNFNPWATRVELAFLKRYVPKDPYRFGAITKTTERYDEARSYGLMQIMGLVAREKGFRKTFLAELFDPKTNLSYGVKHWKWCLDNREGDVQKALLRWNGGGNPHYPNKVLEFTR